MTNNVIKFISNRHWLTPVSLSVPKAIIKTLPEWYRKADKYILDPTTQKTYEDPHMGKIPTWKGCPAIFDIMGSGYTLITPCDVVISRDANGRLTNTIEDPMYKNFVQDRPPMAQFVTPLGAEESHFAWWPDWAVNVPEGYSVLYSQPFNRFELPFMTMSGIIDNDKIDLPGTMPFLVAKGWTGVIPAGTPYAQMIPFKREDWTSEVVIYPPHQLHEKNATNSAKYRVPDGGVYRNQVWEPRKYE
jgi:hypothetical protein